MSLNCISCKAEISRDFKACPHCGEVITDFLREYLDKSIDGKYQILERIGLGGMGEQPTEGLTLIRDRHPRRLFATFGRR